MADRSATILVNLLGAAGAALFARASLQYYWHTHRLIGAAFFIEQIWFVAAFLRAGVRGRAPRYDDGFTSLKARSGVK